MDSELSAEAVTRVWIVSLVIYTVVLAVVALLLLMILRTAKSICGGAFQIWTVGQKLANNTIHIALLNRTNDMAGGILASATGIVHATAAIEQHARECPGCPACVLPAEGAR